MRIKWIFSAVTVSSLLILLLSVLSFYRLSHENIVGFADNGYAWKPYGGSWRLQEGVMRNNSYERGAKLITGSRFAGDYLVEADVALVGSYGDSGLIVRARDIGEGVDSYEGFFAGLRSLDNSLLLGRADYGWQAYRHIAIPGEVLTNHFYHIRVVAVGCAIAVRVDLPNGEPLREGVRLTDCPRTGKVGLKSYQSPGMWKNFRVAPATERDLDQLMNGKPLGAKREGTLRIIDQNINEQGPLEKEALSRELRDHVTPIAQLNLIPVTSERDASVHGIVRLISPVTYVEDSSGGMAIKSHDEPALAIGDEVVISGHISRSNGSPILRDGHVRILWSDAPSPPMMTTAVEAATGVNDGRLVLVNGRLLRSPKSAGGQMVLELEGEGETFLALAQRGDYNAPDQPLRPGSDLQLTGVLRSDREYALNDAFALLLSPTEGSIRVLREASWWTPIKITVLALGAISILFCSLVLYFRLKQQYLLRIIRERELLAHDLHDTVSQSFAGLGFQLSSVEVNITNGAIALEQVKRAQNMVSESHEELRRSITTLRAEISASNDLLTALDTCAKRLVGDGLIKITTCADGPSQRLPLLIADCFFRIGQEAISNAIQHASASNLKIALSQGTGRLSLSISDDGHGFSEQCKASGHGLFGMAKRAEMIGADFQIIRTAEGTTVLVQSNLKRREGLVGALLNWRRRMEVTAHDR